MVNVPKTHKTGFDELITLTNDVTVTIYVNIN